MSVKVRIPQPYQIVDEYANWINSNDVLKFATQPQFFYYFDFSCLNNGLALQVADFLRMTCSTSLHGPKFLSYLIPGEMSAAPHEYSYSLQNTRSKKHMKNSFFDFSEFKIMLQDRVNEIELTGEHSIWKSQNDLIEANMVAKHRECSEIAYVVDRAAYHAFLDSKSGLLEFQNICPRLIIASILLNKSSVLFRNDFWKTKITFHQYQLDEQVKLFIKKGIYTRARLKDVVIKGIKNGKKNSNQRIVQLLYPWNKIADEILKECFLSAAWLVWDLERSKREVINKEMDLINNFFFRKKIYPIIHLSVDSNGNVILQIWQRYPEHLPDWDLLEIDPVEHAAQLSTWESKCLIEIRESELKHPRGV